MVTDRKAALQKLVDSTKRILVVEQAAVKTGREIKEEKASGEPVSENLSP